MSKELNCMNCCIGNFKDSLCDCDNGIYKEYKKVGSAEDFENEVMNRTKPKTGHLESDFSGSEIPNNSDTISRQWLMECVNEGWIKFDTEKDENRFIHLIRDIAPSVQPVIIRCKDCEHCADDWNGNQPMFTCELGSCGESVMPNDFCSRAERREV